MGRVHAILLPEVAPEVLREPPSHTAQATPTRLEPERDKHPRRHAQHSRHIPAAVRRAVYERDGGRCTFTDQSGLRCAETHRLELHHAEPFAQGGEHTADNLTLHCRAHNALAAEQDFGDGFMQHHQRSENHERSGE